MFGVAGMLVGALLFAGQFFVVLTIGAALPLRRPERKLQAPRHDGVVQASEELLA
jgi:hypothetical protein